MLLKDAAAKSRISYIVNQQRVILYTGISLSYLLLNAL